MMPEHRPTVPQARHQRLFRCAMGLGVLLLVSGCAQLQVHRQSANPEVVTYELRGPTLAHLQTEANRLCPSGFDVARQAESDVRQPGGYRVIQWWNQGLSWLEDERREAQMVITCRPVAQEKSAAPAEVQGQAKT